MNVKNEVHRSLLPLLDEWLADRWDAIEADIRRRKLQVVPPKKPRLKKHLTRLLLCAVLSVAVFGMMLNLPFVSNWFATQKSVPVESKPLSQDIIVVNEVEGYFIQKHNPKPLDISYMKKLKFDELINYLEYDISPSYYPNDLFFRHDIFQQRPPTLEYDEQNNVVNIVHNTLIYTSDGSTSRRFVIRYSKITTQVGEMVYFPQDQITSFGLSIINNIKVKMGHLSTTETFIGFENKLPTERYVAEFTIHGINMQVTADNLTLEEFVAVIKSMIR